MSLRSRRRIFTEFQPLPRDNAQNVREQLRPTMVTLVSKMVNAIRNAAQMCIPAAGLQSRVLCLRWYGAAGCGCCARLGPSVRGPACKGCLLYTSDAADEEDSVDLGGRR